ncbi:hypothetical protein SHK09_15110 [Polaribacter sp. PL03]|uniref:hypothetical protein n=1 Tax=Polaribacter sp. PL03 TaxID=3088353 RepID=UPI0029CBCCC6|nr:hypothetical protein [Polaribacter sp. PL03]MDX6748125.1 hypothetical protein [Polaribacter sp. PL03]
MAQTIFINKTKSGFFSSIGLKAKTKKQVFTISENLFTYNSTLGNLGEIKTEMIDFIELGKDLNFDIIKIGIKAEYKTKFKYKLNNFRQKLSELYVEKFSAEIIVFQKEIDIELSEFAKLLRDKLNK